MKICSEVFDESFENRSAVARVVNREVRVVAQALRFASQNGNTGRVESLEPDAIGLSAQEFAHAVTHFGCCLVGEGNCQNLRRPRLFHAQKVSDSLG